jgi:NAD(P)-dependent dehydrogenase (short-subunit alcohol dehydrogenase family)
MKQGEEMNNSIFDVTGKVAVVTGGGSGLGREFCDVLAEYGADVITCGRHLETIQETCNMISKWGHKTLAIKADVSKYDQVQALFKEVENKFGRLDILVNNAGVAIHNPGPVDQLDINDWHCVIDVDLHGVFYCMKEGCKLMRKQGKGSVINIGSNIGIRAMDPEILPAAPYVAAKHAVMGITRQAAVDYGKTGIRVNCIGPGFHSGTNLEKSAETLTSKEAYDEFIRTKVAPRSPMGRNGKPSELRGALIYLASDASSFMTGQILVSDGGWTAE